MLRMTISCAVVAVITTALVSGVHAADGPTGRYDDASISGKLVEGDGDTDRFDLDVMKFKVSRTKIKIDANGDTVRIKVTLRLRERVADVNKQKVTVDDGAISIRDLATGEPIVWDGDFNAATYRIKRVSDDAWSLVSKKKLRISSLVGEAEYDGGTVKSVRTSATKR